MLRWPSRSTVAFRKLRFEKLDVRLNLSTLVPLLEPASSTDLTTVPLESRSVQESESEESDIAELVTGQTSDAADAINRFASDLYQHLQKESGNLVFSPTSAMTALAMAYAGAGGATAEEMASVLHLGSDASIHDAFEQLLSELQQSDQSLELSIANALWTQFDAPIHESYKSLIESKYGGDAQSLDFRNDSDGAVQAINEWVRENTNDKIPKIIDDLPRSTKLVLANAVYFNGKWDMPFDPDRTQDLPFHVSADETVNVSMMHQTDHFRYQEIEGFQTLEIPYKGNDLSMIVLLPKTESQFGVGISESMIDSINDWMSEPSRTSRVWLRLPKFKSTLSTNLSDLLSGIGMSRAFEPFVADFSGMGEGPLFMDQVRQEALIEVDEEGTEAAAATTIGIVLGCFASGTLVKTPDGTKSIEQIKVGDYVLSRDENDRNGVVEAMQVEDVHVHQRELIELYVQDEKIQTTSVHPFYVKGQGWLPAGDLKPGDLLATDNELWVAVDQVKVTEETQEVFNLSVAEHRTYFVGGSKGGFGIWVHNICGRQPDPIIFKADRPFHYLIRDNHSETILFMGRVSDPSQENNSVSPSVIGESVPTPSQLAAADLHRHDTNGDGEVHPIDALLIINYLDELRSSGDVLNQTDDVSHMDCNGDGIVGAIDALAVINWLGSPAKSSSSVFDVTDDNEFELRVISIEQPSDIERLI